MKDLSDEERIFLSSLTYLTPQKNNGYMRWTKGNKHFKRSRVLMQLHINKKLEIWDHVHHKDRNRTNDNIDNLEVMEGSTHTSEHHAGSKHKGRSGGHNKISTEKEKEIYNLCKIYIKKNGFPNYTKIGKKLRLTGQTIRSYYLNKNNS